MSCSRSRCLPLWLQQILLVPSSLLPLRPAASWRLHRRPAGSRSCDSAPSPPPVTRGDSRQRMSYWLCDDSWKKVLRHQHGVMEWMQRTDSTHDEVLMLFPLRRTRLIVLHNTTTPRWNYSHQQRWRRVWKHTADRRLFLRSWWTVSQQRTTTSAVPRSQTQHKFMHQELKAAETKREHKQLATESGRRQRAQTELTESDSTERHVVEIKPHSVRKQPCHMTCSDTHYRKFKI